MALHERTIGATVITHQAQEIRRAELYAQLDALHDERFWKMRSDSFAYTNGTMARITSEMHEVKLQLENLLAADPTPKATQ